jgi:hypothetical protein
MSSILEQPLKFLRARVATGEPSVERDGGLYGFGVIRGVSIITQGEALGHDMWIDTEFLQSVSDAANAKNAGLKARFTHPGLSGDGLGTMLGKVTDARVSGSQVVGDLHFIESATKTPDGNLADYVMTLAEDTPEDFGLSIVFSVDPEQMAAHSEANTFNGRFVSPDEHNKDNYPHARMSQLRAVDVVDEPAANPDGLFHRKQEAAAEADAVMSYALGLSSERPTVQALGIDADRVKAAVHRFLSRNNLEVVEMAETTPQGDPAPQPTREQFAAECKRFIAAFGQRGGEWFADGKSFDECQALHIEELNAALSAKDSLIAELQGKLAAIDLGEPSPAKFGDATPSTKPKAPGLSGGFASRIRIAAPSQN